MYLYRNHLEKRHSFLNLFSIKILKKKYHFVKYVWICGVLTKKYDLGVLKRLRTTSTRLYIIYKLQRFKLNSFEPHNNNKTARLVFQNHIFDGCSVQSQKRMN